MRIMSKLLVIVVLMGVLSGNAHAGWYDWVSGLFLRGSAVEDGIVGDNEERQPAGLFF